MIHRTAVGVADREWLLAAGPEDEDIRGTGDLEDDDDFDEDEDADEMEDEEDEDAGQ